MSCFRFPDPFPSLNVLVFQKFLFSGTISSGQRWGRACGVEEKIWGWGLGGHLRWGLHVEVVGRSGKAMLATLQLSVLLTPAPLLPPLFVIKLTASLPSP